MGRNIPTSIAFVKNQTLNLPLQVKSSNFSQNKFQTTFQNLNHSINSYFEYNNYQGSVGQDTHLMDLFNLSVNDEKLKCNQLIAKTHLIKILNYKTKAKFFYNYFNRIGKIQSWFRCQFVQPTHLIIHCFIEKINRKIFQHNSQLQHRIH